MIGILSGYENIKYTVLCTWKLSIYRIILVNIFVLLNYSYIIVLNRGLPFLCDNILDTFIKPYTYFVVASYIYLLLESIESD